MGTVSNGIDNVSKILEWLPKLTKVFSPFRPKITQFQINYKQKTATLFYTLDIDPSGIRKKIGKIELPKLNNYKII